MLALAADLPQAVIGMLPSTLEELEQSGLERPGVRGLRLVGWEQLPHEVERTERLAVHIELELPARRVPDVDG